MNLQAASVGFSLQELLQPDAYTFTVQADLTGASFTCKVRQTLASDSAIITLTSPTDIAVSVATSGGVTTSTVTVTFTTAHFTALLAGLSGPGVIDCLVTPVSGAPQLLFAGTIAVTRTVSR